MYLVRIVTYVSLYLFSYQSTHRTSQLAAGGAGKQFVVRLKMTIKYTQRYTWMPVSCELTDALGRCVWVSFESHLEAMIRSVYSCPLRPGSLEFEGINRDSLEIHLEAMMDWVRRCNWSPWSSEMREERDLEAVDGRHAGCWDSINRSSNLQLCECDEVTLSLSSYRELAGGSQSVGRYPVGWSQIQGSTNNHENDGKTDTLRWMLYLVYTLLSVCCTEC